MQVIQLTIRLLAFSLGFYFLLEYIHICEISTKLGLFILIMAIVICICIFIYRIKFTYVCPTCDTVNYKNII